MPLAPHLDEYLRASNPKLVLLRPDELDQLVAYLKHPDRITIKLSRLYEETRRGVDTYRHENTGHEQFHRYLCTLRDYNLAKAEPGKETPADRPRHRVATDVDGDRRIYDRWKTKRFRRYVDLATELACRPSDVKRALDRHRKRIAAE